MADVFASLRNHHRHWLKKLLDALLLTAVVPILNSALQLSNISYYARWFYMLVFMMCLATLISLGRESSN